MIKPKPEHISQGIWDAADVGLLRDECEYENRVLVANAVAAEREACAQLVQQTIENDGRINNLPELIRSRP